MPAASDRHAARLTSQRVSVLIADSVLAEGLLPVGEKALISSGYALPRFAGLLLRGSASGAVGRRVTRCLVGAVGPGRGLLELAGDLDE
jgi:hypothetical protein